MMSVREILSGDGPIARALGAEFEPRPEQTRMGEGVARAMEQRGRLLVEAGTGVGKSFAYLVPAMLRIMERGEVVVVATNTIALQEQLLQKDIPFLRSLLDPGPDEPSTPPDIAEVDVDAEEGHDAGGPDGARAPSDSGAPATLRVRGRAQARAAAEAGAPGDGDARGGPDAPARFRVKPVLVKGRGNYLSVRRLKLASSRQDRMFADPAAKRSLHAIEDWAYSTTDGSLSTLPALERMGVWDKVQSDSHNCMGRKCPTYQQCFYQRARRAMELGNLLVCNHALFFSDLALRARGVGFLPAYHHVILDEAHGVEDAAADHFGVSLSEARVNHLLGTLAQARTGKGYLPHLALQAGDLEPIRRTLEAVSRAGDASRKLFEDLSRWRRERGSGRVREAEIVENTLTPAMRELALRLRGLKDQVTHEPDKFELNSYAVRAGEVADIADAILAQALESYAYWVEVSGGPDDPDEGRASRYQRVEMACAPVDVAPLLKEHLFGGEHSVVLTSATLSTRTVREGEPTESAETAFAHTMARLGCEGAQTLQLGSPFDYARQVEVYVERDMPPPGPASGAARYNDALAAAILRHVDDTDGGAFVLFTSFATLNAVGDRLAPALAARRMPLLAQGRSGSRSEILARFREDERSVLLGAASFWQGVDVRGRGLRNVIIAKLPFEPPDRPLTEARLEAIQARGGDPFREDSLPRAIIRFKQGFGRLIRSAKDTGRVVILDPRVLTTGYGRAFLAALPPGVRRREGAGGFVTPEHGGAPPRRPGPRGLNARGGDDREGGESSGPRFVPEQ